MGMYNIGNPYAMGGASSLYSRGPLTMGGGIQGTPSVNKTNTDTYSPSSGLSFNQSAGMGNGMGGGIAQLLAALASLLSALVGNMGLNNTPSSNNDSANSMPSTNDTNAPNQTCNNSGTENTAPEGPTDTQGTDGSSAPPPGSSSAPSKVSADGLKYPMGRDGQPIPLKDNGNKNSVMKWGDTIKSASTESGVPASLIAAMMDQESGGNAGVATTNPGNGMTDSGLMQMNPATLTGLVKEKPELQKYATMGSDGQYHAKSPEDQVHLSAALMGKYLKNYNGDVGKALRAYNSGEGAANGDIHTGPGGTDPDYVINVIGHQPLYKSLDG